MPYKLRRRPPQDDTGSRSHHDSNTEHPYLPSLRTDDRYKAKADEKKWKLLDILDIPGFGTYYLHTPPLGKGRSGAVVFPCFQVNGSKREWLAVKRLMNIHARPSTLDKYNEINILYGIWEARVGGHKNVIKYVTDFETVFGLCCVLELEDGQSLLDLMKSCVKGGGLCGRRLIMLDEEVVQEIMRGILDGLRFLHSHGVVHRDLKPNNIIFGKGNIPKIIDFELSSEIKEDESFKYDGPLRGSVLYNAPESVYYENIRGRTEFIVNRGQDVFSCGVILYQIETGNPMGHPFRRPKPRSKATRDLYYQVNKMREAAEKKYNVNKVWDKMVCSSGGKELCKRMLHPDPNERYTARQAYDDPWLKRKY